MSVLPRISIGSDCMELESGVPLFEFLSRYDRDNGEASPPTFLNLPYLRSIQLLNAAEGLEIEGLIKPIHQRLSDMIQTETPTVDDILATYTAYPDSDGLPVNIITDAIGHAAFTERLEKSSAEYQAVSDTLQHNSLLYQKVNLCYRTLAENQAEEPLRRSQRLMELQAQREQEALEVLGGLKLGEYDVFRSKVEISEDRATQEVTVEQVSQQAEDQGEEGLRGSNQIKDDIDRKIREAQEGLLAMELDEHPDSLPYDD